MMYWNGDWNWGAWVAMSMMMVVFWGLVIVAIVAVARTLTSRSVPTPQEILDERFARGELSVEEYEERSRALRDRRSTS